MHAYPDPPRAVYLHIPFCTHKCYYCDFNSYPVRGQPVEAYLHALVQEMELTVHEVPPREIETIFIGGGTPTVLTPEELSFLFSALQRFFPRRSPELEFTVEANPGSVDEEKLHVMREAGVNRLSFGAQSFNDRLLQEIGRIHQRHHILESVDAARRAGFTNLSLDLMFGLPNQRLKDVEESLDTALSLELEHYSVYSLIVEENTPFYALSREGRLPLPSEEEELAMYLTVMERMKNKGYIHYEISNFARPGRESRHNQVYWRNESYYGLGAGAHGYVRGWRHENVKGVHEYIRMLRQGRLPRQMQHAVSPREAMEDTMMVGMRLTQGVSFQRFRQRHGCEMEEVFGAVLADLIGQGLVKRTPQGVSLTERGLLFGNEVFAAFLPGA